MPYVSRNKDNQIIAVYKEQQQNATEEMSSTNPEIIHFLFSEDDESNFDKKMLLMELSELRLSDLGLIRVVEDLIYVLLDKNIINLADLPEPAVRRLKSRQAMRLRLESIRRVLEENPDADDT